MAIDLDETKFFKLKNIVECVLVPTRKAQTLLKTKQKNVEPSSTVATVQLRYTKEACITTSQNIDFIISKMAELLFRRKYGIND
ncbi:hypothetical protein HZS_5793 [Henneguya salminicola]|nr:hypothetical protein HZS_5793 [Henneguya salminicola]